MVYCPYIFGIVRAESGYFGAMEWYPQSSGDFTSATTHDFATDVESALKYMQSRKEIDKKKIGFRGSLKRFHCLKSLIPTPAKSDLL